MRVEDYEYVDSDELEDEITLTDERKEELIKKVKDQIVRGSISVLKILRIGKNDVEYDFIYDWLTKNEIKISGANLTLSGELEGYKYIKRLGISKLPEPLKDEEQQRLFMELNNMKKSGDYTNSKAYQDIRKKLISHSTRLAVWTVGYRFGKSLKNYKFEREDLEQIAMETLINAVDQYDTDWGIKFSTYAVPRIYYAVGKEWRKDANNNVVLRDEWQRLENFEDEMLKKYNRKPTDEEIKKYMGLTDVRLENLKKYINYHLQESLDNINKDDEETIITDLLDDERIEERGTTPILNGVYIDEDETGDIEDTTRVDIEGEIPIMKEDLKKALGKLTDRQKRSLELRYGLNGENQIQLEAIRSYTWNLRQCNTANWKKSFMDSRPPKKRLEN